MPHGLGQLPVEIRSSAVGVSATRPPAINAAGFNRMEMFTPIAAFADVANYAVNLDGVNVEALLRDVSGPITFARIICHWISSDGGSWPPLPAIAQHREGFTPILI
jgi:hypothetical protein